MTYELTDFEKPTLADLQAEYLDNQTDPVWSRQPWHTLLHERVALGELTQDQADAYFFERPRHERS